MKEWAKDNIGNYSTSVPGYAFDSSAFKAEGIPVIKIANIKNGYIDLDDNSTEYVDEHYINSLNNKYQVRLGDILVSLTGSHLTQPNSVVGRVGRYRQNRISLLNQRAAKIEAIKSKCDNGFLYYLLSTNTLRKEIALLAYGAANQANVSHKDIEKIKVFFPSLPIQRKTAAILSAYDDLMENNTRRITILEKVAEELYREWFVRLRFPGHEKVKIVKGVPEGWEVKRICDLGRVVTGKTPPTANRAYFDGQYPFIKTPDMHDNLFVIKTEETLTEEGIQYQKVQTLPPNSISVSCIGTGGVVAITSVTSQTNQQINSIILNEAHYREWAFFNLRNMKELIQLFGYTGSTMTNLSKGKLENLKFIMPPDAILKEFNKITKGMFDFVHILQTKSLRLTISRDRLLSRLMSGKIDVENMDIEFPASMKEEPVHA